ncbi:conserved Plasmodium protein, unknown function [Plasmodium yoelii]|uniref:Uncharacterized protein n=3 Tax=Plasmodium yoelii TaxID=5861 RepID=A0AAE9WYT0_PLAYO|nr:conserved Plasmodium protein, unknown function [Plasmodium yoelii]WBY59044.1 hypothetical protein Py17XNL_001204936 [Plasmodium yoelii yoelii]CDU19233.1 conserved Plasmodium protein, unknown function [Plasmodium yoelii]VTZ79868.1 conserved Plasmodium protein, unknown function [Plasmodium yoelii]|eukprot:XP_022812568.1 conserved Plasmodium protein, unknown function [Plasmodium yoelii]
MERSTYFPKKFERGVSSIVDVLFKNKIFHLYYSFDKIKEYDGTKNPRKKDEDVIKLKKYEKSKKNIEKIINLGLTIIKTIKGNDSFLMEHVLENYNAIKINSKNNEGKKKIIKFDDEYLNYQLNNNKLLEELKDKINNMTNEHIINNEETLHIGTNKMNSYLNKIPIIDKYIDKNKTYSKEELSNELNNFFNNFYLEKFQINISHDFFKASDNENQPIYDDGTVTSKLFSEYFNNCKKDNKLNILIKEINLNSLKIFKNILYKNIKFIRVFNAKNWDTGKINSLQLSKLFDM